MGALKLFDHDYRGFPTVQREDGYWDATSMCAVKAKRLDNYLASPDTAAFLGALSRSLNLPVRKLPGFPGSFPKLPEIQGVSLIEVTEGRNGGTWVHRKVALHLSMWLDAEFGVWVINVADELLTKGRVDLNDARSKPADAVSAPILAAIEQLRLALEAHEAGPAAIADAVIFGEAARRARLHLRAPRLAGPAKPRGKPGRPPGKIAPCRDWLAGRLADGPKLVGSILAEADRLGFSTGTLYRAAEGLNVARGRSGRAVSWSTPDAPKG